MADDAPEPTTPTTASNEEELKKARIRAAKLKAKSKVTKKPTEAATTTEGGDKTTTTTAAKKEFDLKGKKRFEVKKWNAVALWAWGMFKKIF